MKTTNRRPLSRGPGRPVVFHGHLARRIVLEAQRTNVMDAVRRLADEGINISPPTVRKLAVQQGVKLVERSRPRIK